MDQDGTMTRVSLCFLVAAIVLFILLLVFKKVLLLAGFVLICYVFIATLITETVWRK